MSRSIITPTPLLIDNGQNNLKFWLDASDSNTIVQSGGKVSSWLDKSGNGNHATQLNAANQPTTNAFTVNGLNSIDFPANTGMTTEYDVTGSCHIFLVENTKSDSARRTLQSRETNALLSGGRSIDNNGYVNGYVSDIQAPFEQNILEMAIPTSGSVSYFINGIDASGAIISQTPVDFRRVALGASGRYVNEGALSEICEVVIFNRTLSEQEIEATRRYFFNKWGVIDYRNEDVFSNLSILARYDFTDQNTITESGGLVSQVDDISGNNRNAVQLSVTRQPTLTSEGVFFNNDYLEVSNFGSGTYSWVALLESVGGNLTHIGGSNTASYLSIGQNSGNRNVVRVNSVNDPSLLLIDGGKPVNRNSVRLAALNNYRVYSNPNTPIIATDIWLGYANDSFDLTGTLKEVICFDGNVTKFEIAQIVRFLKQKHGI